MRSDAIAEYREAIRLDPKLGSAWINLATILARDPRTRAEARAALETAKKIDPSDPRVKPNLEELDSLEKGGTLPP
jgi:cytochrome c-type biogenesis protein CcmH/NrfG